jgi:hypothetical protein
MLEPCSLFVDEWVTVSEPEIAAAMLGVRDHHDGMMLEGVEPHWRLPHVQQYCRPLKHATGIH